MKLFNSLNNFFVSIILNNSSKLYFEDFVHAICGNMHSDVIDKRAGNRCNLLKLFPNVTVHYNKYKFFAILQI